MGNADRGLPDNGNARRDDCDEALPELGAAGGIPFERVTRGVPAPEAREQYTGPPGARKAIRAYPQGVSRSGHEQVRRPAGRAGTMARGRRRSPRVESVTGRTAYQHIITMPTRLDALARAILGRLTPLRGPTYPPPDEHAPSRFRALGAFACL
jgi:hypothetical protein